MPEERDDPFVTKIQGRLADAEAEYRTGEHKDDRNEMRNAFMYAIILGRDALNELQRRS